MKTETPGRKLDHALALAKQEYDEAKLKIHLANLEAKQEWDSLQDRWLDFCDKCQQADEIARESEGKVHEALHEVGEELKNAFRRIKQACH